jgi:uncharacterized protein YhbP (UPF0306 family)
MAHDRSSRSARESARRLLATTDTCTLATASPDGVPEAATVRFVADDDLTLYLTSGRDYRKYDNLTTNPAVAVVVDGESHNLQLEGEVREVRGNEVDYVVSKYVDKYGHSEYLTADGSVFFEITVDWARLLVDGHYPPDYAMIVGEGETAPHGE